MKRAFKRAIWRSTEVPYMGIDEAHATEISVCRALPRSGIPGNADCNRSAGLQAAVCPAAVLGKTHLPLQASPICDSRRLVYAVNGDFGLVAAFAMRLAERSWTRASTELSR